MVSVREPLVIAEPVLGSSSVELFSRFLAKWKPDDIEAGFSGLPNPFSVGSSLDSGSWPIPGVLGLKDVELRSVPHGHDAMGSDGASSVHDHWVETVQSENEEEISRFDLFLIDVDHVDLSLWEGDAHSLLDELDIGFLHVLGRVGSDDWNEWMVRESTSEKQDCLEEGIDLVKKASAEEVSLDSAEICVSLPALGGEIEDL